MRFIGEAVKRAGFDQQKDRITKDVMGETSTQEVDEHYFDPIVDPALRHALVRFERNERPKQLSQRPVSEVVDAITKALGVTDGNMRLKLKGLKETARNNGILCVEPTSSARRTNKYHDPSDVRALFILFRERAKVPWQKQIPLADLARSISLKMGDEHELHKRFISVLPKAPDSNNSDGGKNTSQSESQVYIYSSKPIEEDIPMKKPEPPPLSLPMDREESIRLLRSVDKKRMRDLHFFLLKKFNGGEGYIDFNSLQREVFPMIQLTVRARAIIQGRIDEFDPEMKGLTYFEAAEATGIYINGALSEPRVAQADGSQFYRLVELMERAAREKQHPGVSKEAI